MKQVGLLLTLILWVVLFLGPCYGQTDYHVTGFFLDTLKSEGNELRLVITIQKAEDGIYTADFKSIDQGCGDIAFDEVNISGKKIYLISRAGIQVEGEFADDYSKINAEFRQGAASFPLEFIRVEQVPDLNWSQTPKKPVQCYE